MSIEHYENFPVASLVLPKHLRRPVATIYQVLRYMDDIADEGDDVPETRQRKLDACEKALNHIQQGKPISDPLFLNLAHVLTEYPIPITLFKDMVSAFQQDTQKNRYQTCDEVLDYCKRSANPVGRMMLCLFGTHSTEAVDQSDSICTSLQLINFWQDIGVDYREKNRCYIPLEMLEERKLRLESLDDETFRDTWRTLIKELVNHARQTMLDGALLSEIFSGRIKYELRLIVLGGLRITDKIAAQNFDTRHQRPILNALDWVIIFSQALCYRYTIQAFRNKLNNGST